jgi:hypothetical protein
MSEIPEALRLAENLENPWHGLMVSSRLLPGVDPLIVGGLRLDAAIELRRLHADSERLTAENERLRDELRQNGIDYTRAEVERLREVLNRFEYSSDGHIKRYPEEEEVISALRREET